MVPLLNSLSLAENMSGDAVAGIELLVVREAIMFCLLCAGTGREHDDRSRDQLACDSCWMIHRFPPLIVFPAALVDRPDQRLDLFGVWAELPGEFVEIGIRDRREAGFIDVGDNLHPDRFQL